MLRWISEPSAFWDEQRTVHVAGVGNLQVFTKRKAFPASEGATPPLFLGVITLDDVSISELRTLTAVGEGVAKLRFDPTLNTFQTRLTFTTPWGLPIRYIRTHTRPVLLGLISAREVDSICAERQLPDGGWLAGGFGVRSPRMARFCGDSSRLRELREEPPTPGMVPAIDYLSGYVHEPLDEAAKAGGRGRCRSWYFLSSEAGGGVPRWASDRGVSGAISNFYPAAWKELQRMRADAGLDSSQ